MFFSVPKVQIKQVSDIYIVYILEFLAWSDIRGSLSGFSWNAHLIIVYHMHGIVFADSAG